MHWTKGHKARAEGVQAPMPKYAHTVSGQGQALAGRALRGCQGAQKQKTPQKPLYARKNAVCPPLYFAKLAFSEIVLDAVRPS